SIPELYGGEDSAYERPAVRHKSKRTADVACCHGHLDLGCMLMCQDLVGAKVICSRRMVGANEWGGTAAARTRHGAGSEEVSLQSAKREKRQLQSGRETTGAGNSLCALDSSAVPFRKSIHKLRQQLRTWMFESI